MGSFTFHRSERLKRQKLIQELFDRGSYFYLPRFKVLHLALPASTHQVLFSVSKRSFKRAVDRNRVKRKIREGYRLHKHRLDHLPTRLLIAYIYTGRDIAPSREVHTTVIASLEKLKTIYPPPKTTDA